MAIQKGDQYRIPFSIKVGDTVITTSNCDDIKISVCGVTKTYSDNELYFNSTSNTWEYPLTEAMTKDKKFNESNYQVAVKSGSNITYSKVTPLQVFDSIINEEW